MGVPNVLTIHRYAYFHGDKFKCLDKKRADKLKAKKLQELEKWAKEEEGEL